MPKWPFKWPFKGPSDPVGASNAEKQPTGRGPEGAEPLHRIEQARKFGTRDLELPDLKLSTLPETIFQLSRLQTLILSGNQLSTLPETISNLPSSGCSFFPAID